MNQRAPFSCDVRFHCCLETYRAASGVMKRVIEAEMEEFRTLQLDEKKVFLANLEGMERKLKEKEKDVEEVCAACRGSKGDV